MSNLENFKVGIIGLGYVGLPLAVEFGKQYETIGFDINQFRVKELLDGCDSTLEVTNDQLKNSKNLQFSTNIVDLENCNIFIVTVPTPIDSHKNPNLNPLIEASKTVGSILTF